MFGLLPSPWALPCVPLAGPTMGTSFVPPPVGSSVWVEFEQGDPETPIWVGCFWETPETLGTMAMVAGVRGTPVRDAGDATQRHWCLPCAVPAPRPRATQPLRGQGATSISLNPAGVTINAPTVDINTPGGFTVNKAQFTVT